MSKKLTGGWPVTGNFDPTGLTDEELMSAVQTVTIQISTSMLRLDVDAEEPWTVPERPMDVLKGNPVKADNTQKELTSLARLLNEQDRRWNAEDGAGR